MVFPPGTSLVTGFSKHLVVLTRRTSGNSKLDSRRLWSQVTSLLLRSGGQAIRRENGRRLDLWQKLRVERSVWAMGRRWWKLLEWRASCKLWLLCLNDVYAAGSPESSSFGWIWITCESPGPVSNEKMSWLNRPLFATSIHRWPKFYFLLICPNSIPLCLRLPLLSQLLLFNLPIYLSFTLGRIRSSAFLAVEIMKLGLCSLFLHFLWLRFCLAAQFWSLKWWWSCTVYNPPRHLLSLACHCSQRSWWKVWACRRASLVLCYFHCPCDWLDMRGYWRPRPSQITITTPFLSPFELHTQIPPTLSVTLPRTAFHPTSWVQDSKQAIVQRSTSSLWRGFKSGRLVNIYIPLGQNCIYLLCGLWY